MKLERVESYAVRYVWADNNGVFHEEFDCGIAENELEQIVANIISWVRDEGNGTINIFDITFTKEISFREI